jgi:hypothetical protein
MNVKNRLAPKDLFITVVPVAKVSATNAHQSADQCQNEAGVLNLSESVIRVLVSRKS